MSWDLFTSAEPARREPDRSVDNREALAHAVAGMWADGRGRHSAAPAREWSVSAINAAARELVEGSFPPVRVVGEVANFTRARSGHCYFSLRDDGAQIRCVMWRDDARRLPTLPAEGMEVRALGRLSLYEARGEFQLIVSDLEGLGDGLWKLALERVRAKLEAEGLTSPARKRPLPQCPSCIGVVTSPTGAVFHDILNVVRRRAPWTDVILCGCRVQGDGAAAEIAAAISLFGRARCADVLIVGRGGGSVEDLWAFNEEIVARAIAACPVPVISAVGHETDVTLADLVADLRAPTPSAAAEAAVPDRLELRSRIGRVEDRMRAALDARVERGRERVESLAADLDRAAHRFVARRRERVATSAQRLEALSPLAALRRGYAVPLDDDGRVLRSTAELPVGRRFNLRVSDGSVACHVDPRDEPR